MECKIISLAEYRKSRKAQARILKRLIERHLAEAGRMMTKGATDFGMDSERPLRERTDE